MNDDSKNWKGLNGPLPGGKPRNDPPNHEPEPAAPPPQQKWQPGELPLSQPRQSGPPQDSAAFRRGRTDPPSGPEHERSTRMDSVLPIYNDQPQDPRPVVVQERNFVWWMPVLGFSVVAGIILIVALVVMREPLSDLARAHACTQQKNMIEAEQRAEYAALDAHVRTRIRDVRHALVNLDVQAQGLVADAELRLGQPLHQLQSSPRDRLRELDLEVLSSKESALNWASLVNATATPTQSKSISDIMADLESRAREGKLIPDDRDVASGLLTLVAQQEELAGKRAGQVQRLLRSLEARKLEMSLEAAERNQVTHAVDHPSQ